MISSVINTYQSTTQVINKFAGDITLLLLRLTVAKVFLTSGLSKWNGFLSFNQDKYDLFLYEFFCPDPIREGALLLCDPATLDYTEGSATVFLIEKMAVLAGVMEVILPLMLIFGLATRIGAAGLIGMTLFIQLAVFPGWDHWWNPAVWWFLSLLAIFAFGPGKLSIDKLISLEK